jgi:phytanoyl-CoA hydroxylase
VVLTPEQRDRYRRDGYLAYDEPLLSPADVDAVGRRIVDIATGRRPDLPAEVFREERDLEADGPRDAGDYDRYRVIRFLHKYDDLILSVCRRAAILDVVEDLIGPDIKLYTDQVFMKPPFHGSAQPWHQDSAAWPFFLPHDHVTCWIAIDDATVDNGCLRYLPGTHALGLVDRPHVPVLVEQLRADGVPELPVPREPGYGVFHHSLLLHSSGPNTTPHRRRGLVLHYISARTRYLGLEGEWRGPFLSMRGRELAGRV